MIVRIDRLRLTPTLGVHDWERRRPREILATIEFEYDASAAATVDDVRGAVDYAELSHRLAAVATSNPIMLLETLAQRLLDEVMSDDRIQRATVEISKPAVIRPGANVSVTASAQRTPPAE